MMGPLSGETVCSSMWEPGAWLGNGEASSEQSRYSRTLGVSCRMPFTTTSRRLFFTSRFHMGKPRLRWVKCIWDPELHQTWFTLASNPLSGIQRLVSGSQDGGMCYLEADPVHLFFVCSCRQSATFALRLPSTKQPPCSSCAR